LLSYGYTKASAYYGCERNIAWGHRGTQAGVPMVEQRIRRCDFEGKKRVASPHSMWRIRSMTKQATTEMIMSTTFGTPATAGWILQVSRVIASIKALWTAHLARRIERAAILQLHAMSDRELQDIGLTRCQIEWAVRGERENRPRARRF
jgi:uncharacterized protein YjiS (DUF1127 family)